MSAGWIAFASAGTAGPTGTTMDDQPLRTVIRFLQDMRGREAPPSDYDLLRALVEKHDENAFAILVHRHGPMVLSVCRRMLRNECDAEDAFQATFLFLAK